MLGEPVGRRRPWGGNLPGFFWAPQPLEETYLAFLGALSSYSTSSCSEAVKLRSERPEAPSLHFNVLVLLFLLRFLLLRFLLLARAKGLAQRCAKKIDGAHLQRTSPRRSSSSRRCSMRPMIWRRRQSSNRLSCPSKPSSTRSGNLTRRLR